MGKSRGINYIDSTLLRVCDKRRIHQHRGFKDIAQRGQCSSGWFYGFKLHIVTNDEGGIIDFMITKGNVDDRKPLRCKQFIGKLYGKLFGDKGYISNVLAQLLFQDGIRLITKVRKNMKKQNLSDVDAVLLRKRALVEWVK